MRAANDIAFCLMFNYLAELFPTKIWAFTNGLMIYMGWMTYVLGPFIIRISDEMEIHPLVLSFFPCVLGLISAVLLPETY